LGRYRFTRRLVNEWRACWAIMWKDMRVYYIKPPVLMFGIMFPLFMFLSFAVGRSLPSATLISGLMAITILFSSSSIGPGVIPTERKVKTFERLISAPISLQTVLLGKTLGGFIFSVVVALIPLLIGLIWFGTRIEDALTLAVGISLSSFGFSAMGIMFASFPTENPGDVMMMLNFVRLPLIFISGVFIPIAQMPFWGQVVALFSPLTYSQDLIRYGLEGHAFYGSTMDTVLLLFFTIVFLALGTKLHKKYRE